MTRSQGAPASATPGRPKFAAREPIVMTNLLGALALEVCTLLRTFGVPLSEGQQQSITVVVGLLILLGAALLARLQTTSLADPRDDSGRRLVPRRPTLGGPVTGSGDESPPIR